MNVTVHIIWQEILYQSTFTSLLIFKVWMLQVLATAKLIHILSTRKLTFFAKLVSKFIYGVLFVVQMNYNVMCTFLWLKSNFEFSKMQWSSKNLNFLPFFIFWCVITFWIKQLSIKTHLSRRLNYKSKHFYVLM